VGTTFLLIAIVGSGIMAETLTTDPGLQLSENALATAAALTALILALGSVYSAHFNQAVTLADRAFEGLSNRAPLGTSVPR
jgi:glycerol uptake facilitator-like aquaporin